MKSKLLFFIIVLISKISFGQDLAYENYSVLGYLSNNLKGINISICDTLTEKNNESYFVGNYLKLENGLDKKFFYLKFDSVEFSLDSSIRDTFYVSNNYDIFFIESGTIKIGFILAYDFDENNICYGVRFVDRILLFDH